MMRMGIYAPFATLEETHSGLDLQCKILFVGRRALRQDLHRRLKDRLSGWRDGSEAKRTNCCSRGPEFNSNNHMMAHNHL